MSPRAAEPPGRPGSQVPYPDPMPTTIHFLDGSTLEVEEEPDEVQKAIGREPTGVVKLAGRHTGTAYILPAAIAYWEEARSRQGHFS